MSNAELIVAGIGLLLTIAPIVFLGGRWVGGVNQRLDQQGALLEHHGALLEHHGALLREILNDVKTLSSCCNRHRRYQQPTAVNRVG